jgi:RNA polymerase sigma factor (sigma-70 family)
VHPRVHSSLETGGSEAPVSPAHAFKIKPLRAVTRPDAGALIERVLREGENARQSLIDEYGRGMRFVLHRQGMSYWDAAEIAQEAWTVAITKVERGELRDVAALGPFLCGVARRLARNWRRKMDRQCTTVDTDLVELFEADADAPELSLSRAQNAELVWKVLASLRRRDRDVLDHFFLRGEDKDEVCARLGIAPARFHGVLYRAKQRFHGQLCRTAAGKEMDRLDD